MNWTIVISFLATIASSFLTWYIVKIKQRNETDREMLEKVYSPILEQMRPHMFKFDQNNIQSINDRIKEVHNIINKNPMLVSCSLRLALNDYEIAKENKAECYNKLCLDIRNTYSALSSSIGFGRITIKYIKKNKWYCKKSELIKIRLNDIYFFIGTLSAISIFAFIIYGVVQKVFFFVAN